MSIVARIDSHIDAGVAVAALAQFSLLDNPYLEQIWSTRVIMCQLWPELTLGTILASQSLLGTFESCPLSLLLAGQRGRDVFVVPIKIVHVFSIFQQHRRDTILTINALQWLICKWEVQELSLWWEKML